MRERPERRSSAGSTHRSVEDLWDETVSLLLDRRAAKQMRERTRARPGSRALRKPKRG